MPVNRYNPNESPREPYRNIRFTVTNDELLSVLREIEGRSGESASSIARDSFVTEIHENYSHYLE
jgi:hypothetical protein